MNLNTGIRRKTPIGKGEKAKTSRKKSTKSRLAPRGSRNKSKSRRLELPKTVRARSRKSRSHENPSKANSAMSVTDLQFLAKSRGIPFGGLTKTKLIRKINNYY